MNVTELMIGDWVIDRVSMPDSITKVGKYDFMSVRNYELEPIPLTEDILKANGYTKFSYGDESISFQIGYHYNNLRVSELIKNKDEDFFVTCMGLGRIEFHYVHELQHALRLGGLSELANNFKINK